MRAAENTRANPCQKCSVLTAAGYQPDLTENACSNQQLRACGQTCTNHSRPRCLYGTAKNDLYSPTFHIQLSALKLPSKDASPLLCRMIMLYTVQYIGTSKRILFCHGRTQRPSVLLGFWLVSPLRVFQVFHLVAMAPSVGRPISYSPLAVSCVLVHRLVNQNWKFAESRKAWTFLWGSSNSQHRTRCTRGYSRPVAHLYQTRMSKYRV